MPVQQCAVCAGRLGPEAGDAVNERSGERVALCGAQCFSAYADRQQQQQPIGFEPSEAFLRDAARLPATGDLEFVAAYMDVAPTAFWHGRGAVRADDMFAVDTAAQRIYVRAQNQTEALRVLAHNNEIYRLLRATQGEARQELLERMTDEQRDFDEQLRAAVDELQGRGRRERPQQQSAPKRSRPSTPSQRATSSATQLLTPAAPSPMLVPDYAAAPSPMIVPEYQAIVIDRPWLSALDAPGPADPLLAARPAADYTDADESAFQRALGWMGAGELLAYARTLLATRADPLIGTRPDAALDDPASASYQCAFGGAAPAAGDDRAALQWLKCWYQVVARRERAAWARG